MPTVPLEQLRRRAHLRYIHLSESDRGTPGVGRCDCDGIFTVRAAIGFEGVLARGSLVEMPPEIAQGLSVWRPVAKSANEVIDEGRPFLRNKAG